METKVDGDWLVEKLKKQIVTVSFTKIDGSRRVMKCTLKDEHLPKTVEQLAAVLGPLKKKKNRSPDMVTVWDVEKNDWRSFKLSAVTGVSL